MTDYKELVILGLLKDGPKHGYEIKKLLKNVLRVFTTVDTKSIYYPLRVLQQKGFLQEDRVREGLRPERHVFRLTPQGDEYFKKLLVRNLLALNRPFVNIDLSLYFFPFLDLIQATHTVKTRLRALERIKRWLQRSILAGVSTTQTHRIMILRHNLRLIEAEIEFTQSLLAEEFGRKTREKIDTGTGT